MQGLPGARHHRRGCRLHRRRGQRQSTRPGCQRDRRCPGIRCGVVDLLLRSAARSEQRAAAQSASWSVGPQVVDHHRLGEFLVELPTAHGVGPLHVADAATRRFDGVERHSGVTGIDHHDRIEPVDLPGLAQIGDGGLFLGDQPDLPFGSAAARPQSTTLTAGACGHPDGPHSQALLAGRGQHQVDAGVDAPGGVEAITLVDVDHP